MARRRLSDATRWQIIGMSNAGLSGQEISRHLGYSQSVICRLLNKFQQTNQLQDRARSGRPRKTSRREDGALLRLVRRFPFLTSTVVKQRWLPNRPLSTRTVRNRLRASGYRAHRPIRRPMLTPGQKAVRLYWCQQRRNWNIRSWRKIHLSDESRFLLHFRECRVYVWRQRNTLILKGTSRNLFLSVEAQQWYGDVYRMIVSLIWLLCKGPLLDKSTKQTFLKLL